MPTVSAKDSVPAVAPSVPATVQFPLAALQERLRKELAGAADESDVLHGDWDPVLDSLRVVSILVGVEDLFPGIPLPPEKLIRPGGYRSIDDAVSDMSDRFESAWNNHHATRTQ